MSPKSVFHEMLMVSTLTHSGKSRLIDLMNANKRSLMKCRQLLTVIIFPLLSHGSRNDWNDLAHFKASSLPSQIFSSHVWFIIPFRTLSFSCQQRTLFWKVYIVLKGKKTQMANQWTSLASLIFQTALFHLSSPTSESNLSFLQIHTFSQTKHINLFLNLFSSNNPAHRYYLSSDPVTGQLYVSDTNSRRIYRPRTLSGEVEPQANIEVVAGTGDHCLPFDENQCGDGGPASEALLTGPKGTNKAKRYSADPDYTRNGTNQISQLQYYHFEFTHKFLTVIGFYKVE